MVKNDNNKEKVSVLAFERKIAPSDGFLYETTWENRTDPHALTELHLHEKSVRGTISHRMKESEITKGKINNELEKANPQTVDSCALDKNQDTLVLKFTIKFFGGLKNPSACNNVAFLKTYQKQIETYLQGNGMHVLALRYAQNLANARFLWRNRVGAEQIETVVTDMRSGKKYIFDSMSYSLWNFENAPDQQLEDLAGTIEAALKSDNDYAFLEVESFDKLGKASEVFPSEEMVIDKRGNDKSKILYAVKSNVDMYSQESGVAAMHSQKIGNAIRTIDTWYASYPEEKRPIAIEIYGAVTTLGKAYREKDNFYTLFDKYGRGAPLADKNAENYVIAVLIRGGVFGENEES